MTMQPEEEIMLLVECFGAACQHYGEANGRGRDSEAIREWADLMAKDKKELREAVRALAQRVTL